MKVKNLIDYLAGFAPDDCVSVLPVDLVKREVYKTDTIQLMTGTDNPVFVFELGSANPLDDVLEETDEGII